MALACLVGGTFDRSGGRPSKVIQQLAHGLTSRLGWEVHAQNGGTLAQLKTSLGDLQRYRAVLWFPDVANDEPQKLVEEIKRKHPTCILVVSKRNDGDKYGFAELMQRALAQRAALLVEFRRRGTRITCRALDPLGNCFQGWTDDVELIGKVLAGRIAELSRFTRVPSQQVNSVIPPMPVEELEPFFSLTRKAAGLFHEFVPTTAEDRLLGNSSFRCQQGFPSISLADGQVWVSRRNIDKRFIGPEGFVAVETGEEGCALYRGTEKPSVDAPIHLRLYRAMGQMRYAIHGHVYLKEAPMTREPIPCGAVEEAEAIMAKVPNYNVANFAVNLRGHGFIAMAASVGGLAYYLEQLHARPAPEML